MNRDPLTVPANLESSERSAAPAPAPASAAAAASATAPTSSVGRRVRFSWKRPRVIITLAAIGAAALLVGSVAAVPGVVKSKDAPDQDAHRDVPTLDGKLIRFSTSFARREGVSDVPVQLKELSPVVNVTGTVTTDARKFVAVGARIGGRVRRIFKVVGDDVRARDIVAQIESAELGRAEAHVLAMRAKEMAAEAHEKRERRLADAHVASERDAELARAEYDATRAERMAGEKAFAAMGGDLDGEIGVLTLRSPMAGKVIASRVARGQTVAPTDTLFEVADLSTLWIQLSVFERDLPRVRVGDPVEIEGGARAQGPLVGRVEHVGDVIDLATRSAPVRVVIAGQDSGLRPGQSVDARIQLQGSGGSVPTVPRVAVTRIDGKPTVLVLTGPGVVEPREIQLGPEDGVDATVLDGLRANERVIAQGLFALKSELFR